MIVLWIRSLPDFIIIVRPVPTRFKAAQEWRRSVSSAATDSVRVARAGAASKCVTVRHHCVVFQVSGVGDSNAGSCRRRRSSSSTVAEPTRCQCYKTFFSSSLMMRSNRLEGLHLETLSSQVLEFEGKARANPIGLSFRCFLLE
jgi:hypothetical protein